MLDLDLAYLPATEQARLIRTRRLSPVELVANALARVRGPFGSFVGRMRRRVVVEEREVFGAAE